MCKLLCNAHFCACPQLHPSVHVHLALGGSFQLLLEQTPSHLPGGLAVSWLPSAPSLIWLQGIPLCLVEIWCLVLFSLILLSMCVRSPSWVYPLNRLCWSSHSFSRTYFHCLFLVKSGSPLSSRVPSSAFHTLHTWSVLALNSGSRCWIPSLPHHVTQGIPFTENTWIYSLNSDGHPEHT